MVVAPPTTVVVDTSVVSVIIDTKRDKFDVPATVAPSNTIPIVLPTLLLFHYHDGEKRYILAPQGLKKGMKVVSSKTSVSTPRSVLPCLLK